MLCFSVCCWWWLIFVVVAVALFFPSLNRKIDFREFDTVVALPPSSHYSIATATDSCCCLPAPDDLRCNDLRSLWHRYSLLPFFRFWDFFVCVVCVAFFCSPNFRTTVCTLSRATPWCPRHHLGVWFIQVVSSFAVVVHVNDPRGHGRPKETKINHKFFTRASCRSPSTKCWHFFRLFCWFFYMFCSSTPFRWFLPVYVCSCKCWNLR